MRCPFCEKNVIGEKHIVVLSGEGPAHRSCYERDILGKRIFAGLHLPSLETNQLNELKEMVITELNARFTPQHEVIELF